MDTICGGVHRAGAGGAGGTDPHLVRQDFADGVPALRILLVGQVIAASYGSQLYVMTMTKHERGAAALLIVSAAVNIVASIFFISILGLTGAAIATTIALIVWNVTMHLYLPASAIAAGDPRDARIRDS